MRTGNGGSGGGIVCGSGRESGPTTADFRHLADAIPQLAWIAGSEGVTPSLILLDLVMPVLVMLVMDGFDVLKRLRQRPGGGLVPVVVLTARDVTPEERACLDRQAQRIISKGSLNLPDLARELRDLIPSAGRS